MVKPAIKEIQRRPGVKMEAVCDMVELSKTTIGGKSVFLMAIETLCRKWCLSKRRIDERAKIYLLGALSALKSRGRY